MTEQRSASRTSTVEHSRALAGAASDSSTTFVHAIRWGLCWVPGPEDDRCDLVQGHDGDHASVEHWPAETTWAAT